jgi:hypothetical protein
MPYSHKAVEKAVEASNRSGHKIGARERAAIHRLLQGRQRSQEPEPEGKPELAAGADRFLASITRLGFNVSTADRVLGIGRTSIYRIARGQAAVPPVVARLLDMYERFGIPEEHRP